MQITAHDVAAHIILDCFGPMRAMKLEKLCYYSQAWNLAWHNEPLFHDPVQAFVKGPIVRTLWNRHRGMDIVRKWSGHPERLSDHQRQTINRALAFYGTLTGNELSALTHSERPWMDAREGLAPNQPGTREITHQAMREFYGSAKTLVDSDNLQEMMSNLVRRLPNGDWGVNTQHPQPLYVGYASRLLAPMICQQQNGQSL
jgi:uncharacterized phage-associated protein